MKDRPRSDVLILNDNDTPMAFVVVVLERFFGMSELEAITHMGRIHEEGKAICGTYWNDVAENKVKDVLAFAREHKRPLKSPGPWFRGPIFCLFVPMPRSRDADKGAN